MCISVHFSSREKQSFRPNSSRRNKGEGSPVDQARVTRRLAVGVLLLLLAPEVQAKGAQTFPVRLPDRIALADVDIAMEVGAGGGCLGRCMQDRVVIRGSGIVEYTDLGGEPRD
jgi:hypothetical protein